MAAEDDPVLLAYERDQAWRLMKHYMDAAERARREQKREARNRFQVKIKADALDRIYQLVHFGNPTIEAIDGIASQALKDYNSLREKQKSRS